HFVLRFLLTQISRMFAHLSCTLAGAEGQKRNRAAFRWKVCGRDVAIALSPAPALGRAQDIWVLTRPINRNASTRWRAILRPTATNRCSVQACRPARVVLRCAA